MLPKKYRLTRESDFKKVLREGRITKGGLLSLAFYKAETTTPQIGMIVSNKISKKAVERNRIKRIIRATVRGRLDEIKNGACLVFLANKKALGARGEDLAKESLSLLKRSGVLEYESRDF